MKFVDKDLMSVQEARILMEDAGEARKQLSLFEQEKLDQILTGMLEAVQGHLEELARMAVQETGYGNWQDQYRQSKFICGYLSMKLADMRCVGILKNNVQEKTMEIGVPLGTVAAVCPAVSPVSSVIGTAVIAIKSGNAIVFSPHKRAVKTTNKTVDILAEAGQLAGLPKGAIACVSTVTKDGTVQMLKHPETSVIINTGVPELLLEANESGMPLLYGGIVPSPVFIERTADIKAAARTIINSRSFDFGTASASEQYVIADSQIASELKMEMIKNGAYFMSEEEEICLSRFLGSFGADGEEEYIGKSAHWLAERAGFMISEEIKVLVSEQAYISDYNPYAKALLCPIMAFYIEPDWMHACEKCIELLVNESHGHTLAIHSEDEEVIRQFALKKPVGRILVNTSAAFGAMGATTNLFPSMTLGSISAGMGVTADNVSPMNLVYIRTVGYGVREFSNEPSRINREEKAHPVSVDGADILKLILEQLSDNT